MKITATIQARMGSSRLPGKVLADVCGKPMLQWQIERIMESRLIDEVIVVTSTNTADDVIEQFCKGIQVTCYRDSEEDVLSRVANALVAYDVEVHAEFCGDSPLADPQIIDEAIGLYLKKKNEVDYLSSAIETTYPPGFEVTIYGADILIETNRLVEADDRLREHAGFNITRFPDRFKIESMTAPPHLFEPNMYVEVDTPEDLEVLKIIVDSFLQNEFLNFRVADVIRLLKANPDLALRNQNVIRRWKSLREE